MNSIIITTFPHVRISNMGQDGVKISSFTPFEIYNNFVKYQQKSNDVEDEQRHFILAEYSDLKGARVSENINHYSSIVIDFDNYRKNYEFLKEEITSSLLGLNYLFYTTSSHTLEKPRVRLILFTNRNFLTSEKSNILINLTQNFSSDLLMAVDKVNSFGNNTLSRLPYKSSDFEMIYYEGKAYFIGEDKQVITPKSQEPDFEKEFRTLTSNLPIPDLSEDKINFYLAEYKKLVGFDKQTGWISNYEDWLDVGMILHHQYQGSAEGLSKWEKWCCESSAKTKYNWSKFTDNKQKPKTFKSIIKKLNSIIKQEVSIGDCSIFTKQSNIDLKLYAQAPYDIFPYLTKSTNKKGLVSVKIKNTYVNFVALMKFYKFDIGFDIILKEIVVNGESDQNIGLVDIEDLMEINNMFASKAAKFLYKYAMSHKYNSFLRLVQKSKWDGVDRLEDFYNTIQVKSEYEQCKKDFLLTWLKQFIYTSCFSFTYDEKETSKKISRYVLVLQSQQEGGKSTWVKNLIQPSLQNKYIAIGATLKTDDDQHTLGVVRKLIVELGELEKSFRHSDINAFKAFFGRTVDTLKVKWVTFPVDYERTTSFIASTNDYYFLKDNSGSTRFLILPLDDAYRTDDGIALFCNANHGIDMLELYRQVYESEDWVNFELSSESKESQKKINAQFTLQDTFEDLFYEEFTNEINVSAELYNCTDILKRLGYSTNTISKKLRNDLASFLRKKGFPNRKDGPKWRLVSKRKELKEDENNIQEEDY